MATHKSRGLLKLAENISNPVTAMTLTPYHHATHWVDAAYDLTFEWLDTLVDSWQKPVSINYGNNHLVVPRWLVLMILIGLTMAVG